MPQTLRNQGSALVGARGTLPLNDGKVLQTRDPGYLTGSSSVRGSRRVGAASSIRPSRASAGPRSSARSLDHMDGDAPPFFIVGNDRSGTTMLRLVLDRSAEAAIPPESMFLLDFAPVRRRGGLEDPARPQPLRPGGLEPPQVRLWGLAGPAAGGAGGTVPRGGVPLRRRGALPRLRPRGRGRSASATRRPRTSCRRRALRRLAGRAGGRARPRRPRRGALRDDAAVRPQQRVRGRAVVGARHPPRARGRASHPSRC